MTLCHKLALRRTKSYKIHVMEHKERPILRVPHLPLDPLFTLLRDRVSSPNLRSEIKWHVYHPRPTIPSYLIIIKFPSNAILELQLELLEIISILDGSFHSLLICFVVHRLRLVTHKISWFRECNRKPVHSVN